MQSIEEVTKVIANIMALSAIPTLGITIAKYFYEKNKDIANRSKNGYMPLYEFFFRERYSKEYVRNELAILTRTTSDSLYDLIKNRNLIDKSQLPFKLVKLLCEYEFYMDVINTGLEYLSCYENRIMDRDSNDELLDIHNFKEYLSSYYTYGISSSSQKTECPVFDGVFAEDYISMIDTALKRVEVLYNEIEKAVFKVIGKPKYFHAKRMKFSPLSNSSERALED